MPSTHAYVMELCPAVRRKNLQPWRREGQYNIEPADVRQICCSRYYCQSSSAGDARPVGRMIDVPPIWASGHARSFVLDVRVLVGGVVGDRETDVRPPARRRRFVLLVKELLVAMAGTTLELASMTSNAANNIVLCK